MTERVCSVPRKSGERLRMMKLPRALLIALAAFATLQAELVAMEGASVEALRDQRIRIRIAAKENRVTLASSASITVESHGKQHLLPAGTYRLRLSDAVAAVQRFHLFTKTFAFTETWEAAAYIAEWRAQDYGPEIVVYGKRFQTEQGEVLDNTRLWVSLARFDTLHEADALKTKLHGQSVWGWTVAETVRPGTGFVTVTDDDGKAWLKLKAPVGFRADRPVEVRDANVGFWKERRETRTYGGAIEAGVGPEGLIDLCETLAVDDYLAGVLPAEMPALWPAEALKAQAVAARSDVLTSMAGKHMLEGFNFCATEHCRAYLGHGGRHPASDEAVAATRGMVVQSGGRIVAALFSSNCGGWTEDNDTVWSSPPDPALRGVGDFPRGKNPAPNGPVGLGMKTWLKRSPQAYCSDDGEGFRWTRRYTAAELTGIVNEKYRIGAIKAISPGERGASGRLKRVRITGTKKTVIIEKDLNIRFAFGGLPSTMFIVEVKSGQNGPESFTFIGGGRGHGVGLCQHGARGMALASKGFEDIATHYFSKATVARLR